MLSNSQMPEGGKKPGLFCVADNEGAHNGKFTLVYMGCIASYREAALATASILVLLFYRKTIS